MLTNAARTGVFRLVTVARKGRFVWRESLLFGNCGQQQFQVKVANRYSSSMADNGTDQGGQEAAGAEASQQLSAKQLKKKAQKEAKLAKFNEKKAKLESQGGEVWS